ncbi:hypothetical protein CHS0354_029408 [Potamilus streckersoni]|uniref:Uncharacterized protein n=1 Tax=Potamilus streckersoni TaxID=2493646 RepID=A0AAE0W0S9_9BIVA|nr:hypothetical protein CHS0354_029408 [Potamilus streckersoni]
MYKYTSEADTADEYQRSVRERANASLHELENVFSATSPNATLNTSTRVKEQLSAAVHPRTLRWYEDASRPQKYKDAATHLQNLLKNDQQSPFTTQSILSVPLPPSKGPLPNVEETFSLLQNQAVYIQQLEAENRYMKDEFAAIRVKIKDILEENQKLHEELKKSILEEIFGEETMMLKIGDDLSKSFEDVNTSMTRGNLRQWQIELEKLSTLHAAKTERLEVQLKHEREEIQKYEQLVEDLRHQIRLHEAIPTREDGLLPDLYINEGQRNMQNHIVNRLTKERDDLMEMVGKLKSQLQEMSSREEEAYEQMKKGIELVEEAQLEQTQAMIQKEQLAEELNNMKQRFDTHVHDAQVRIQEERESVRKENKAVVHELNTKIRELTEQLAGTQNQMEKVTRDKVAMMSELEDVKIQLRRYDKEVSMVTETFNAESTNAKIQKSNAEHEMGRLRKEIDTLRRERDQDRMKLNTEIEDLRRRLNKAERDVMNSKEECIHLTTNNQALERELHLAKLARDSIERGRSDDLKAMTQRSQQREEELNSFITDMEDRHSQTVTEMDSMLSRQNKLISKLKEECKRQALLLEKITKKNRHDTGHLKHQNEELRQRLERALTRLHDLEEQTEQHTRLQEKMKERVKMMDDHAQHQGTQILELLAKQTSLMRDRQILARELEFLRRQITKTNDEDLDKYFSSNKNLVNEVLQNMNVEDKDFRESYITKSKENARIQDLIDEQ